MQRNWLKSLVAVVATVVALNGQNVYSESAYRLPERIVPKHYDLELDVSNSHQFSGAVSIQLQALGERPPKTRNFKSMLNSCFTHSTASADTCQPDRQVILHADKSLIVDSVKFSIINKKGSQKRVKVVKQTYDGLSQFLILNLDKPFESGQRGMLNLTFHSQYSTNLRGLYQRHYIQDDGKKVRYVASALHPTYARSVFPCFDEPQLKTTFRLTVKHRAGETAVSNHAEDPIGPDDHLTTVFKSTFEMSTHSFGFVVGMFEQSQAPVREYYFTTEYFTTVYIYTPKFKIRHAKFALEMAARALQRSKRYLGFAYPMRQMSIVAVPDREPGTSSHFGLAIMPMDSLLFDEETSDDAQFGIALNVAHVVAQQWFGHLITADWWDFSWFTSGMAAKHAISLMRFDCTDYGSSIDHLLRSDYMSPALMADDKLYNGLSPLSPPYRELVTRKQIDKVFGPHTFIKSGALLGLMNKDTGETSLYTAIRMLIKKRAYGSVSTGDLIEALEEIGIGSNFLQNYQTQLHNSSWPVIEVHLLDDHKISFQARRIQPEKLNIFFSCQDSANNNFWGKQCNVSSAIKLPDWFDPYRARHMFDVNRWLNPLNYFRVKYPDSLIEPNFRQFVELNRDPLYRQVLIDDATGLVLAGHSEPESLTKWLQIFRDEKDFGVIIALVEASKVYASLGLGGESPVRGALLGVWQRLGFVKSERASLVEMRAQRSTLSWLIETGEQQVIEDALRKFDDSKGLVREVYLREPVYIAVVLHGTEKQVQQLLNHLTKTRSNDEKARLISALTKTNNKQVLLNTLGLLVKVSLPRQTKLELYNAMKATEFGDAVLYLKPENLEL